MDETPLLSPRYVSATTPLIFEVPSTGELDHEEDKILNWEACKHEAIRTLQLAWPIACSLFLSYGINLVGVGFVGRLGELQMSTALLALSFFNVTGMSVITGFAGVLETVCGQAYGAGHYRAVGVALQRGIILAILLCAMIGTAWQWAEPAMLALGQTPEIAAGAAAYLQRSTPALFCSAIYGLLSRYLLAQGQSRQPTIAAGVATCASPLYNWLFIFKLGWGLKGATTALVVTNVTLLATLTLLVWYRDHGLKGTDHQTWHGWSTAALRGWGPYGRIGLPSVAMVVVEFTAFEVCVLESGWLPRPAVSLAVMGLCLNTSTLMYMMPAGIAAATSSRVGNALGAGAGRTAARLAFVCTLVTFAMQCCLVGVLVIFRRPFISILTTIPEVIEATERVLLVVAVMVIGDGLNCTMNGVLRGSGRQALGATMNITYFWTLALPFGNYLAFRRGLGVDGLWWGLVTGGYCLTATLTVVLLSTNWDWQVERAKLLTAHMGVPGTTPSEEGDENGYVRVPDADPAPAPAAEPEA